MRSHVTSAAADFSHCGQGLRVGGDVKLRGVLVGTIGGINLNKSRNICRVTLDLFPDQTQYIPVNSGAEIRAKTIFGEKWVEILYPKDPSQETITAADVIPENRTLDPLEVETILNTALPLLDAVNPEHLAGALEALAGGFVGHEDAAIRGIEKGTEALRVPLENEAEFKEGIDQLAESGHVLTDVDDDLLRVFANLDTLNRFAIDNSDLIHESLDRAPDLLNELSTLFQTRFGDLVKLANSGATVLGIVSSHANDLERLLEALPRFNAAWIRNLNHVCRFRQQTDEPGKSPGDRVPGRCWRVHNLVADSRGAYPPGKGPEPGESRSFTTPTNVKGLLLAPADAGVVRP